MKTEDTIKPAALPLSRKTLFNIMHTQNVLTKNLNEILKPHDLSSEQFNVLWVLRNQKGKPVNMGVLQENMISKSSNTTRLVDKLLLKGFVTREVCRQNRRKIDVSITAAGLEFLQILDPAVVAYEERFANNLTTGELENLNLLLEKYMAI